MNAFSVGINPTKNLIVIEVVARGVYYKRKVRGGRWLVIREARENDWGASRYVRRNKPNGTALSAPAASQRPFNHALTHFSPYLPGTFKKVSPGLDIARSAAERARIHQTPPRPESEKCPLRFSSGFHCVRFTYKEGSTSYYPFFSPKNKYVYFQKEDMDFTIFF